MVHQEAVTPFHLFTDPGDGETATAEAVLAEVSATSRTVRAHGSVPLGDVLIAGAASLTALTHLVVSLRRHFKRGIMIDALGSDGLVIKADGSLPRGLVVVRHPDGRLDVRDAEGVAQALAGTLGGPTPDQPTASAGDPGV